MTDPTVKPAPPIVVTKVPPRDVSDEEVRRSAEAFAQAMIARSPVVVIVHTFRVSLAAEGSLFLSRGERTHHARSRTSS